MEENHKQGQPPGSYHLEDMVMKTAAQYFGAELLQYLGIRQQVQYIAPTELVQLEARQMYQDFNYELEDRSWLHLEFESDPIRLADLKRFREYEAATSRRYQVPVVTCVICTTDVKKIRSEFTEGLNTYRVKVIRLKDADADEIFAEIQKKISTSEILKKEDLLPMLLSPLMGGTMRSKDRIRQALGILNEPVIKIEEEELRKMQAVLYALADKLLDEMELQDIKEVIAMTRLGQMLMEDGIEKGMERGMEKGIDLAKKIFRLYEQGETAEMIAKKCNTTEENVRKILEK
ncbi:hypothetical protein KTH81_17855 [Lachnospiraceae bacterium ASD3451]|uniref:hypothetical protein n=1 Tax=Diplocloster agilis TaxID=2850323 RepID=UPI001DBBD688|nr:hypothetical protein [Diplocloster agilis]MBU9745691.1 hypothetical protein [Diplocloster agilis]